MITELSDATIQKYLERRADDYRLCLTALTSGDYQSIARVGHNMKGNGETFGFPELSSLGTELELAALSKNIQHMEQMITRFETWVNGHFAKGPQSQSLNQIIPPVF